MSIGDLYVVVTTKRGERVIRASRTGERIACADVSLGDETFRLMVSTETKPPTLSLMWLGKRWKAANVTPLSEWTLVGHWVNQPVQAGLGGDEEDE